MPPLIASLAHRLSPSALLTFPRALRLVPFIAFHLAALAIMVLIENGPVRMLFYLLTWGLLNFVWLALLRRPALAAGLSFSILVAVIWISRFKHHVVWMTANFMDVMIIDVETLSFLWNALPQVRTIGLLAAAMSVPLLVLLWRIDPWRLRRRVAVVGAAGCFAAIVGVSAAFPLSKGEVFDDDNNISVFVRTGIEAVEILATQGYLESDAEVTERLKFAVEESCHPAGKRPHIILLHDESSFDISAVEGVKVPPGYGGHFRSFDGKERRLLVEGAGGPSWYTEYNVLAGLSSRSFGRFQFFVTRIAAGRVSRGLPFALRRCGYRTFSIYPVFGAFLGTRSFYTSTGVENFIDGQDIRGGVFEPDRFYFDYAARIIARERDRAPMFLHVYLTANHFPYDFPFRSELTPRGWRDPGNAMPEVNEYLRRQAMTERDYKNFIARLKRDFPGESFLIVRFGDHQPNFAKLLIDPDIPAEERSRRIMNYDPRYYSSYYAIDAINFRPVNLSSALDVLDAPYLPLVVQEAAGLPLEATFAEQKRILQRCRGLFYACGNGAEARRFNRLLIDAGLIKGL
jgi:phosphoglycerol transferase MdoB-like AlkP superfamily enzyme